MVRINLVPTSYLTDQHLNAEVVETLMLRTYILNSKDLNGISKKYVLGKGHIKFWKDKVLFLERRFKELVKEQERRGFKHNSVFDLNNFKAENLNDWNPNSEEILINLNRIIEKISLKPNFYRYFSKKVDNSYIENLINYKMTIEKISETSDDNKSINERFI